MRQITAALTYNLEEMKKFKRKLLKDLLDPTCLIISSR